MLAEEIQKVRQQHHEMEIRIDADSQTSATAFKSISNSFDSHITDLQQIVDEQSFGVSGLKDILEHRIAATQGALDTIKSRLQSNTYRASTSTPAMLSPPRLIRRRPTISSTTPPHRIGSRQRLFDAVYAGLPANGATCYPKCRTKRKNLPRTAGAVGQSEGQSRKSLILLIYSCPAALFKKPLCLVGKIGLGTTENEPSKVCQY